MKDIRILLVDGRGLMRQGLRHMLETEEDMKVVGDYASAEEALIETVRLHQDIVLMSTQMPGMNWLEATRHLKRSGPGHGGDIIILAESLDYRAEAMEAGAASYLCSEEITHAELTRTIREVYGNRHSLEGSGGLVEEAVELVIPPSVNAAQLLRFMCQLAEILHDDFASIICTVGSWDSGTIITIRPHSATPSALLITLANMPQVEKAEEELPKRDAFSSFTKKLGFMPRLGINPSKRISVILKEDGIAKEKLVTVLK